MGDGDVGVEDVGLVEGEGLGDLEVVVGVFEGEGGRRGEIAGGGGDIEAAVDGLCDGGVVGVERERMAELLGSLVVDEIERTAVAVLKVLEHPAGDLGSSVGEGDAVELILDDGAGLGRGLYHGYGGGSVRYSRGTGGSDW